ncbi:MAG: class I SAM-dependent methyltransferase [Alphaproteobacteria bacterium]|nr:class I SAM-dependent methyltransferase [Alphaproteobacteria bacterium]
MTAASDKADVILYDEARAAAWRKWFHIMEAGAQNLSDRMVALASVTPGSHVLDIATGLGEPALTAAHATGPSGRVLATDLSADMLAFAKERANAVSVDHVEFRVMDANRVEFPEATFDAVLSRWGMMFVARLDDTLAAIRSCLKPGGVFVAAVWGDPEEAPAVSLGNRVLLQSLGLPPPEEGPMTPFALRDTDALRRRARDAGFGDVSGEWVDVVYDFETVDVFVAYRRDRSGSLVDKLAHVPAEDMEAAWRSVGEAAGTFTLPDGTVRMTNRAFCLVARR